MKHNALPFFPRSMTRWATASMLWVTLTSANALTPSAPESLQVQAQQFTLANGMSLIVKPDRRAPTAVHMLWLRVGSMEEVDGTSGVAHVLEHMLFKGTPNVPGGEFSRRVAALGGRDNAFTSHDYTGYYQQIPSARLADVMQLEADRFAHNQWPDEEFKKELEVVKEERRMRTEDNPRALMYEALNATVFVASPYRRPIVGWMSDLEALKPEDARAFYQRWYVPANAAVVVAGDVDVAEVRRLAEKYYGSIPSRAVPERKPRVEPMQTGIKRMAFKAPAEQALVTLAYKVPSFQSFEGGPDEDDALALTVLAAVLDGYSGARLERALTQGPNRLADSAGADNGLWGRGPQLFTLSAVPAQGETAEEVEAALREQVARIAAEGVSEAELNRVKTQWVASEVYKLDSVFNQARELGTSWVQGQPLDANERVIERLRTVTAEQVKAVASKYFGDDQLTVARLLPQPLNKERKPRAAVAGARH
ncbi:MAG: peptidase M16 [Comamonadaceae bacterium CG_4_9_14_3_um_filter_60_33]|nr:MAG: peptidase M16 [Comamonadaceae bacterium CG_4_10_14_3_um_filter_60_42]PJB42664.1 MAG: peptidase M16 [Comamonadaceae bacterium CG_4_9_14_3_um_filter_60_33]